MACSFMACRPRAGCLWCVVVRSVSSSAGAPSLERVLHRGRGHYHGQQQGALEEHKEEQEEEPSPKHGLLQGGGLPWYSGEGEGEDEESSRRRREALAKVRQAGREGGPAISQRVGAAGRGGAD